VPSASKSSLLQTDRDAANPQQGDATAPAFPWFIVGVGTWFTAVGMQSVLFSWLVVGVLHAKAEWVGIAQSALMLPSVLLMLVGGAVADRHDRRTLLIGLHLLASVLSTCLVVIVANGWLSLSILIVYALLMGTIQAFVMPARDSLLSEVAGPNLTRAVASMTLTQWGMQALGALVAGTARWIGTVPALGLHALTLLVGVPTLRRLPPAPPRSGVPQHSLRFSDIVEGIREVAQSPVLPSLVVLVAAVGALFIGPFLVVFPILIRDYYGGDVGQLALLNMAFPLGTILGSVAIVWRGRLRRKGIAQLVALLAGAGCLGVISFGLPLWGTLTAVCGWGVGAAVFVSAGRTVFQEQARPSHRARVLSVYMLGFMGTAGLIGAPLSGVLVEQIGPLATCAAAGGTMVIVVILAWLCTGVARVE